MDSSVASSSNDSLSSLNSQLLTHGWAKRPLNLDALSERDLGDVISVFFELLGSSINNIENLDVVTSRHRTLQYEYERIQKAVTASRAAQRRAELEAAGWRCRVNDLETKVELGEHKFREMREEASRGRKALEGVRVAAGHETKKLQLKLDQSNAKLVKLAHDSTVMNRSSGMIVLNPIPQSRSQPMVIGQDPFLEQSLQELAVIRQSLEEETEAFRHVIVSTGNLLREAIAVATGAETPERLHQHQFFSTSPSPRASSSSQSAPSISHPQIAADRLQSLIASLRTKLEAKIIRIPIGDALLSADPEEVEAQAKAERERERERQDLLDRVKDLQIEVECTKAREEESKRSLDEYARAHMQETMDKASERENDAGDLLEILREREKLEDERRKMVDAMGKLNKEKRILERERLAFEEERRRADVDDVLAQLPSTPAGVFSSSASAGPAPLIAALSSSTHSAESSSSGSSLSPAATEPYPLQPWTLHQPHSPSPLSPHKPRTPKAHIAKTKRTKTPLSRLVLEKAVRRRSQGLSVESSSSSAPAREALGEGSKRVNAAPSGVGRREGEMGRSSKGKERIVGDRDRLMSSTRASEMKRLGGSTGLQGASLAATQSRRGTGGSLGKISVGPGTVSTGKGKAMWR